MVFLVALKIKVEIEWWLLTIVWFLSSFSRLWGEIVQGFVGHLLQCFPSNFPKEGTVSSFRRSKVLCNKKKDVPLQAKTFGM